MTPEQPMPPTRRRPIRGMAGEPLALPRRDSAPSDHASGTEDQPGSSHLITREGSERGSARDGIPARWAADDYGTTRLVNFRIPVDLHDRFRRLVRETEMRHPRLRKPSLTELVIALFEEGPRTTDEVAGMIRRKRAAEHEER